MSVYNIAIPVKIGLVGYCRLAWSAIAVSTECGISRPVAWDASFFSTAASLCLCNHFPLTLHCRCLIPYPPPPAQENKTG